MRKGGGKQKGSQFERDICKQLSLWISSDQREDIFWRSAMSGGRATISSSKGKSLIAQVGDISCIDPIGSKFAESFYCECKFYANLDYLGLLKDTGKLLEFWLDTKTKSEDCGKNPLLIAKQNRILPMACLNEEGAKQLGIRHRTILMAPKHDLRIVPWHEFIKYAERP